MGNVQLGASVKVGHDAEDQGIVERRGREKLTEKVGLRCGRSGCSGCSSGGGIPVLSCNKTPFSPLANFRNQAQGHKSVISLLGF